MTSHLYVKLKSTALLATAFVVAGLSTLATNLLVSTGQAAAATQSTWMVVGHIAVNPDGKKVTISSAVNSQYNTITISPNGQRLAYEPKSAPGTIVTSNVDGSQQLTIANMGADRSYFSSRMFWSRDSSQVVMPIGRGDGTSDMMLMNANGSGSRRVVVPNGMQGQRIAWVSNTKLMYAQENKVCTIQTDGTGNGCITVANLPAGQSNGNSGCVTSINDPVMPSVSSQWMLVYIGCGSQGLYRISTSLTGLQQLVPDTDATILDYAFSPDGSRFAYLYDASSPKLYTMNIDGTGRQFVGNGFTEQTLSWGAANSIFEPVPATPNPTPTPAPVPTTAGGAAITSQYGGRCLDIDTNGAGASGSKVQLWGCSAAANQRWSLMADGTVRAHYGSNLCLDVDTNGGGVDGNKVQAWACSGASNQRWTRTAANELRSQYTGRCLDVDTNGGGSDGNKVQLWGCSGGSNQKWNFSADPNVTNVVLQSQYTSRCLDAQPTGGGNGNAVYIWDCHGGTNQRWTLNANGSITAGYGGRCLDVDTNGGGANGNKIQLWDCTGASNQRWARTTSGTVVSQYTGRCLDVDTNTGGANGNKIQLWDCTGVSNQRWTVLQ